MISSASMIVLRRCATTIVVLPAHTCLSEACMLLSIAVSSALVASSRRTNWGFLSTILAMATRCFSPPLSLSPLSPTFVS
mmetsp:Transcript_5297/g.11885  ORF Transcript_5297/g.11885 Transcript_5297/m.11885 type:complete len:80 (-) Transcript_5297:1580-1819(-)